MKVAALVPSLNPDSEFNKVVQGLVGAGFERIYIVNDGSGPAYLPLFEQAAQYPQCVLLTHEVNRGKGRAMKTAFEHFLNDPVDFIGLVSLDGDGQHSTEDVLAVAGTLQAHPDALVLGARNFSEESVPLKSRLGNKITRGVFRVACGIPISDTQTGLRGIPKGFMKTLLATDGDRYEFETNMLLKTKRAGIRVLEVPISTIYLNDNAASHFRPFRDGLRIYLLILKYLFSSGTSAIVDILLFTLLHFALSSLLTEPAGRLFVATAVARVCSALYNFFMNKSFVFGSSGHTGKAMLRYGMLCVAQMLCSYGGAYLLSVVLPLPTLPAKILVDGVLFLISFNIQRRWVFAK